MNPGTTPQFAYRERLLAVQKAMGRTKSDLKALLGNYALILAGTGVPIVIIIGLILSPGDPVPIPAEERGGAIGAFMRAHGISFEQLGKTLGIFLWPLVLLVAAFIVALPFVFAWSFYQLCRTAAALRANSESIACPKCDARHDLLSSVTGYTCPSCRIAFKLSGPGPLALLTCPHCAAEFATTRASSTVDCPSCQAALAIDGGACSVRGNSVPCPGCGATMPAAAVFCAACLRPVPGGTSPDFEEETRRAFREEAFDGFSHDGESAGKAAGALLARNAAGTLADARRRIAAAETRINPKDVLGYINSAEMDFACIQLFDSMKADRLRGGIVDTLREADRVHARFARALVEASKAGDAVFGDTGTLEAIGRTYLDLRGRLIAEIESVAPGESRGLPRVVLSVRSSTDSEQQPDPPAGVRRHDLKYKVNVGSPSLTYVIENPETLEKVAADLEAGAVPARA